MVQRVKRSNTDSSLRQQKILVMRYILKEKILLYGLTGDLTQCGHSYYIQLKHPFNFRQSSRNLSKMLGNVNTLLGQEITNWSKGREGRHKDKKRRRGRGGGNMVGHKQNGRWGPGWWQEVKMKTYETYIAIIIRTHRAISLCGQKHHTRTNTQKEVVQFKTERFHKPEFNTTMKTTDS